MKTVQVTEGSMRLFVPEESLTPPHKAAVFYNPNMAENRALSSLALGALLPDLNGSVLLDGFCACGARGIRYALDNFLSKIVFLDANPDAMALARKNAKTNGILDAVFFEGFFEDYPDKADVVEVDPFGSPAPFIEKALEIADNPGIVSVTATDLATLCGRNNKPAARRYDCAPLYVDFAHELGLRIILGRIARVAEKQGKNITPLFSWYKDHYVKIFSRVGEGKQKHPLGFVSHCAACGNRLEGKKKRCACGKSMARAGPLWTKKTCDEKTLARMKAKADKKQAHLIDTLQNENGMPPFHFDAHKLCSKKGWPIGRMDHFLEKLKEKGFEAARTHYAPTAFKTDAPFEAVLFALQP